MTTAKAQPLIVTCDAGGTMTDILLVDEAGRFSVGKASTTPQDESLGFWESLQDAFSNWGVELNGGAIAVRSEKGVGTTVTITLPLRR